MGDYRKRITPWPLRIGKRIEVLSLAPLLTGYHLRLIVISRLHQIDEAMMKEVNGPGGGQSVWDGSLLGPPKNASELGQRISVFWQVCALCFCLA
jgi:hypothetical protein